MFFIAWEYLAGRAVATDPADRLAVEWPPHPDRIYQAMVAAWGERSEDAAERAALEWLAGLGPPQVGVPADIEQEGGQTSRCFVSKTYVPVNDLEGPGRGRGYNEKHLALLPANRHRKERYFPAIHVGSARCFLCWPEVEVPGNHHEALARLCAEVTYVGHSSSLVRMWLDVSLVTRSEICSDGLFTWWLPSGERIGRDISMRVPDTERLDVLVAAFAGGGQEWRRPPTAKWQGYRRDRDADPVRRQGAFDERLIVLRQIGGPRLHLSQTLRLTEALHKTLIKASDGWTPEQVSGHEAGGAPTARNHLAIFPLAHVGREHADGHLLGLALALPRGLEWEAEDGIYRAIAAAVEKEEATLRLTLGSLGVVNLAVEDRPAPPFTLRPETWCRPAQCWGTVTPVVLDRLPPRKVKDSDGWAADQIAIACARQGIPTPVEVGILPVSPCQGAPDARSFQSITRKDAVRRWHTHAVVTFAEPISGPLLLGAGRFRGYGLCRPISRREV